MVARSTVKSSASTLRQAAAPIRPVFCRLPRMPTWRVEQAGLPHIRTLNVEPIRSVLYRVDSPTIDGTFVLVMSKDVSPSRNWIAAIAQCTLHEFGTVISFASTLHTSTIPITIALDMVGFAIWMVEIIDPPQESSPYNHNNKEYAMYGHSRTTCQSAVARNEWPRAQALSLLQCPLSHRKADLQNMVAVGMLAVRGN